MERLVYNLITRRNDKISIKKSFKFYFLRIVKHLLMKHYGEFKEIKSTGSVLNKIAKAVLMQLVRMKS